MPARKAIKVTTPAKKSRAAATTKVVAKKVTTAARKIRVSAKRIAAPKKRQAQPRSIVYRPIYKDKGTSFIDSIFNLRNWFISRGPLPVGLFVVTTGVALIGLMAGIQPFRNHPSTMYSPNAELQSMFRSADELTVGERVGMWSAALRDNPKLLSWLENASSRIDNDNAPFIPEAFDCTTFVETVSALARSPSAYNVADEIINIRYLDGRPSWFNRNHFPEADWIPNNEHAGILKDTTEDIMRKSGMAAKTVGKIIYKRKWFEAQADYPASRSIASGLRGVMRAPQIPDTVNATLAYIPLENAHRALDQIPTGSIINIVHTDSPNKPVLVSHQGFLVRKEGKVYFRHAKRSHGIKDSDFMSYMNEQKNRTWRVLGFNVNTLQER